MRSSASSPPARPLLRSRPTTAAVSPPQPTPGQRPLHHEPPTPAASRSCAPAAQSPRSSAATRASPAPAAARAASFLFLASPTRRGAAVGRRQTRSRAGAARRCTTGWPSRRAHARRKQHGSAVEMAIVRRARNEGKRTTAQGPAGGAGGANAGTPYTASAYRAPPSPRCAAAQPAPPPSHAAHGVRHQLGVGRRSRGVRRPGCAGSPGRPGGSGRHVGRGGCAGGGEAERAGAPRAADGRAAEAAARRVRGPRHARQRV